MTGPHPAVARVRSAVRRTLLDLAPRSLVLAAVSGGADSFALADALAFEAPRHNLLAGALVVDHRLQPGSTVVAERVVGRLVDRGLSPVQVLPVTVPEFGGPEAAARDARYQALTAAASRLGAAAVLLGHTLDDQAESVLLGLARGSGARSLSGMSASRGVYRRPLLGVDRADTRAACRAQGLDVWDDPQNTDPRFTRVRARNRVLPVLETELGPGVAAALARSADLLRDDDDALQEIAEQLVKRLLTADAAPEAALAGVDCKALSQSAPAIRRRALRLLLLQAGVPGGSLRRSHIADVDALLTRWKGQGAVDLPGGVVAQRSCDRLRLAQTRI